VKESFIRIKVKKDVCKLQRGGKKSSRSCKYIPLKITEEFCHCS